MADLICPVCGAPEVNAAGLLNIRGFKVSDHIGDWSHCLCDHGTQEINGEQISLADLWFCVDPKGVTVIEAKINGKSGLFCWEGSQ